MKKFFVLTLAWVLISCTLFGQNPPVFSTPADDTVFVGSGQDFLLIPEVDDGDEGVDQEITFELSSSDPSILSVDEISYGAGQTMALVSVSEKGILGTVVIDVDATDADGTSSASFQVTVAGYNNPGINFEVHDVVFWQQFVPLESNPAFSMIAGTGEAPYDQIDLPGLDLSVYSDCQESPPCTGVDFFTALFKGYVIPAVSGEYTFYMIAGDRSSLGLSTD